jgi:hypothetical protein
VNIVSTMDTRNEIREFLRSRRARINPEQARLPMYGGNLRVAGLRRQEVAMLAGVSVDGARDASAKKTPAITSWDTPSPTTSPCATIKPRVTNGCKAKPGTPAPR